MTKLHRSPMSTHPRHRLGALCALILTALATAQEPAPPPVPTDFFKGRRQELMKRLVDGVVLVVDALIDLMEGVEDIPGAALHVGMPWGSWESFGEYLDLLAGREYALDVGAHVAHGALRF